MPASERSILAGFAGKNAAKTHCPNGHCLSGDNLCKFHLRRGSRVCRTCANARRRVKIRMPRRANATSFKKGRIATNKLFASEGERYLAHRDEILIRTRANGIKTRFGITMPEYVQMKEMQGPLCAMCGEIMITERRTRGTSGRSPVLDHDHNTGQLRAFIHRNCNAALGLLSEDPQKFRQAAEYLEKYRASQ